MVRMISYTIAVMIFIFSNTLFAKNFGAGICNAPEFHCYVVKSGDNWKKLYPDDNQRDLVMRVNRMNTRLYKGLKIAVPDNLNADPSEFSPMDHQINPPGKKVIIVDLRKLAFGAYDEQGTLEKWGPVSGGRGYCPDIGRPCYTKSGQFEIYQKGGPGCVSSRFPVGRGGAPMPFCMFFHGGYALHGSPEVPGYNDSHGCVRMFTSDARWLNLDFTAGESVAVIISQ